MAFFSSLKNATLTQDEQKRAQDLTAFRDNINLNVTHLVGGSSAGTVFGDQALLDNAGLSATATLRAGVSCLDAAVGDAVGLLDIINEAKLETGLKSAKKDIDDLLKSLSTPVAEANSATLDFAIKAVPVGTPMTEGGLKVAVEAAEEEKNAAAPKVTTVQAELAAAKVALTAAIATAKSSASSPAAVVAVQVEGLQKAVEGVRARLTVAQAAAANATEAEDKKAADTKVTDLTTEWTQAKQSVTDAISAAKNSASPAAVVAVQVQGLQKAVDVAQARLTAANAAYTAATTKWEKLKKLKDLLFGTTTTGGVLTPSPNQTMVTSALDKLKGNELVWGFVEPMLRADFEQQDIAEKLKRLQSVGQTLKAEAAKLPEKAVAIKTAFMAQLQGKSTKALVDFVQALMKSIKLLPPAVTKIDTNNSDVKVLIAFIDAVGKDADVRYPVMLLPAFGEVGVVDVNAVTSIDIGENTNKLINTGGKFVGCASRVLGAGEAVADLVPVVADLTAEIIDLVPKLGDFAKMADGDFTSVMQVANVANAALAVIDWIEKQVQRAKESQQKHDELWEKKMELLPLGNEQGGASVDYLHADCYDVELLQPHTWGWHNKGTKMVGRTFDECWQACENDSSCFSVVYGPTIESLRGAFTDHASFGHCYLKRRGCDLRQSTSDHFGMQVRAKVGVPVERGSKEALQLSALFNLVSPVLTPKLYAKLAPHVLEPVDFKNSPRASQDSETSRFLLPGAAVPDADLLEQLFVTLPPELFNERIVGLGSIANTKEYLGLRDWTGETSFWLSRPDQLAKLVNENSVERFALIFDGHATARDWYNLLLKEAKAGGRDHVVATIETIEEVLADQKQKVRTNFRGLTPREKLRLRSSADPLLSPWKAAEEDAAGAQERLLRQARTAEKMKEILKAHNSASTSSQARGLPMLPTPHENALDEKDALALEALSQSRERGDELQERLVQLREMRQRGQREQKKQQKEVVDKLVNSYENAAEEFREAAGVYGKRLLEQQEEALDKKDALAQEALSQSRERGDELDERLVEQQRKYEALLKQQNQKAMAQAEEAEKKAEEAEQKAAEAEKRAVAFREQASQQVVKDLRDDNQRLLKVLEGFSQTTQAIFERSKLTVEQPAAATSPSTQISEEMVAAVKPSSSSASKASPVASTQISEEMVAAVKPGFQKAPPSSSTSLGGSSFLGGTSVGGWVALSALAPLLLAGFIAVSYAMCLRRKGRASAARRKTVRQTLTSRQTTTSPDDSAREGVLFSLGGNDDDEEVAIGTGTAVVLN